jgi:hypothetical protein
MTWPSRSSSSSAWWPEVAGGWGHVTDEETGQYKGSGTLENGGDVEEFARQAFGMVNWLAAQLALLSRTREQWISQAQARWREGYHIGGEQPGQLD